MLPFRPESTTLPRGFCFHQRDERRPRTPEPSAEPQLRQPSPPRPTKLKLRRRNVLDFNFAPIDQRQAINTADMLIPTIEVPDMTDEFYMADQASEHVPDLLAPQIPLYRSSGPKTPVPQMPPFVEAIDGNRPDWSMPTTTSPDRSPERPSSAMSDLSDCSDDSYFSSIRTSRPSDDGSCTSPDEDVPDPFVFPLIKGKARSSDLHSTSTSLRSNPLNGSMRNKTLRDVPWSKDRSEHLWDTYQIYLQDPTVTPFRVGSSAIPPEGVVHRVAREAKRSWKGPKSRFGHRFTQSVTHAISAGLGKVDLEDAPDMDTMLKSGSITPTTETVPKTHAQWPHSSAATRNHLRELCKRDFSAAQAHHHLQSRSPPSFPQFRDAVPPRKRRTGGNRSLSSLFSTSEMALSLATSTSDSMRPDGPLASLGRSPQVPAIRLENPFGGDGVTEDRFDFDNPVHRARRLGSPFAARTYGPATSRAFETFLRPTQGRTMSDDPPRLRSPVHFETSRSLNGTQKRRAQAALDEELSPGGGVLRPSILDPQLFGAPVETRHRRVRSRGFSLGDEALRRSLPTSFISQLQSVQNEVGTSTSAGADADADTNLSNKEAPSLLPAAELSTSRPKSMSMAPDNNNNSSSSSNTFPRRLFQQQDASATVRRRPYATVHHARHSIESFDFGRGPSLQSRLTQLDEKLAEIRDREEAGRKRKE